MRWLSPVCGGNSLTIARRSFVTRILTRDRPRIKLANPVSRSHASCSAFLRNGEHVDSTKIRQVGRRGSCIHRVCTTSIGCRRGIRTNAQTQFVSPQNVTPYEIVRSQIRVRRTRSQVTSTKRHLVTGRGREYDRMGSGVVPKFALPSELESRR